MSRSETFKPLYRTLADKISQDIIHRNLKSGDFFCTLKDLCDDYGVSIITVRKAVSLLEDNGILCCKSAAGIYIANRDFLNTLNTFNRIILIPHHHYKSRLNLFFELRLSALLQAFAARGYIGFPIYREDLNSERISLLSDRIHGVVGGNTMSGDLISRRNALPPLLLLNPPGNITASKRACLCRYDFRQQFLDSCRFIERRNPQKIIRIVTDPAYHLPELEDRISCGMRQFDTPPLDHEEPAIETGRRLAGELFDHSENCFFWITDDFVAFGFHAVFLERGVNLIAEKRILANASPSLPIVEAVGVPVIGFCPTKIGTDAASFFCDFLETAPEKRTGGLLMIQPSANRPAQN